MNSESLKAALRLQRRDVTLLCELGEVGLLDTPTLHQRHFPDDRSGQACRRRLRLYRQHALVQQICVSISTTTRYGRQPALFRLTGAGADLLEETTGERPKRAARSDIAKPSTLLHRLGVAKTALAFNDACKRQSLRKPAWHLEYDAVENVPVHAPLASRFLLCHDFSIGSSRRVRCWPDAGCVLSIPQGERTSQLGIFFEYDRSTETLAQVAGKLEGYDALLKSRAFRDYWPDVQGIRIFFIVQSDERLLNIASALKERRGADAVRLATVADLTPAKVLCAPIWQTVSGDRRSILYAT